MIRLIRVGLIFTASFTILFFQTQLYADEIYLKNGDKITGTVVSEDDSILVMQTEAAGEITISKSFVDKMVVEAVGEAAKKVEERSEQKDIPKIWGGEVSAGVNKSGGNTDKLQANTGFIALRKTGGNELKLEATGDYSETDGEEDAQSWAASARYGFDIRGGWWYNFYSLEADHDKFSAIDLRLVPAAGMGYRFADTEEWKLMLEGALGYEYTEYSDGTENTEDPILIVRSIFERTFREGPKLTNETAYYPVLDDFGHYRIRSDTSFTNPLSETLFLRLSFIIEYNSMPPEGIDETDTQLVSSLVYSF